MRGIVSVVVAAVLFIFILYLISSGSIVMSDYWTGTTIALTTIMLGVLYWGFKPQIERFFRDKRKTEKSKIETVLTEQEKSQRSVLLPDSAEITKLNINDELLDQIYEQARSQAINIYYDAQLSYFTIQVYPLSASGRPNVNIYFDFYSKWADKICKFVYSDFSEQIRHTTPDKRVISDFERHAFTTLPWKESPQWRQFLNRVYAKIKPLPAVKGTVYHLSASPTPETPWVVTFDDGFSGNDFMFNWDGKGLDENSIKQVRANVE